MKSMSARSSSGQEEEERLPLHLGMRGWMRQTATRTHISIASGKPLGMGAPGPLQPRMGRLLWHWW